jgi:hypothetical protein
VRRFFGLAIVFVFGLSGTGIQGDDKPVAVTITKIEASGKKIWLKFANEPEDWWPVKNADQIDLGGKQVPLSKLKAGMTGTFFLSPKPGVSFHLSIKSGPKAGEPSTPPAGNVTIISPEGVFRGWVPNGTPPARSVAMTAPLSRTPTTSGSGYASPSSGSSGGSGSSGNALLRDVLLALGANWVARQYDKQDGGVAAAGAP